METPATVDRGEVIREVVHRLANYYHPLRIYLFGSEVRGEARPESDLDFLVVLPDDAPPRKWVGGGVYKHLLDIPIPVDVLTVRSSVFERERSWLMTISAIATREGKILYESRPVAA